MPSLKKVKVLDSSSITLLDFMGSDERIIQAARITMRHDKPRPFRDDKALLRYLFQQRYSLPFEMVEFVFYGEMPKFIADQWHRMDFAQSIERSELDLTITPFLWKTNLSNLFRWLKNRLDQHSQYEIRMFAEAIVPSVKDLVPLTWEVFRENVLNTVQLNVLEIQAFKSKTFDRDVLKNVLGGDTEVEEFLAKIDKFR